VLVSKGEKGYQLYSIRYDSPPKTNSTLSTFAKSSRNGVKSVNSVSDMSLNQLEMGIALVGWKM
jgi:hypothetical protein